ncbi:unnamed protein product [Sphagnum balticum]
MGNLKKGEETAEIRRIHIGGGDHSTSFRSDLSNRTASKKKTVDLNGRGGEISTRGRSISNDKVFQKVKLTPSKEKRKPSPKKEKEEHSHCHG